MSPNESALTKRGPEGPPVRVPATEPCNWDHGFTNHLESPLQWHQCGCRGQQRPRENLPEPSAAEGPGGQHPLPALDHDAEASGSKVGTVWGPERGTVKGQRALQSGGLRAASLHVYVCTCM